MHLGKPTRKIFPVPRPELRAALHANTNGTIPVELDLVLPARTFRQLVYREAEHRFDEASASADGLGLIRTRPHSILVKTDATDSLVFTTIRDRVDAMANQNSDQSWPLPLVRLIVFVAIGIAVGYTIARYWPAYYWPH